MSAKVTNVKFYRKGRELKNTFLLDGSRVKMAGDILCKGKRMCFLGEVILRDGKFYTTTGNVELVQA